MHLRGPISKGREWRERKVNEGRNIGNGGELGGVRGREGRRERVGK